MTRLPRRRDSHPNRDLTHGSVRRPSSQASIILVKALAIMVVLAPCQDFSLSQAGMVRQMKVHWDASVEETMAMARIEAALSRADVVEPEHAFLAVLRRPEDIIGLTFAELAVSRTEIARQVGNEVGQNTDADLRVLEMPPADVPLGPRLAQLLGVAERAASVRGEKLGLSDLFVALIEHSSGVLKKVLDANRIAPERVNQIMKNRR